MRVVAETPGPRGGLYEAPQLEHVKYSHDGMIDMLIANPMMSQNALAAHFGRSAYWTSRIINSDAFKARLAERKADLVDPAITASFEEKLMALADQSLEIVADKLGKTQSAEMALKTLDLTTKAMGYGARALQQGPTIQQTFVVALPQKAASAEGWASQHAPQTPGRLPMVEEVPFPSSTPTPSPDLEALLAQAQ